MDPATSKPTTDRAWLLRRLQIAALPVGVSIAVHLGLLVLIGTITWTVVGSAPRAPLAGEVIIDLDDPAITPMQLDVPSIDQPQVPAPISPADAPKPPPTQRAPGAALNSAPPSFEPAERTPVKLQPLRRRGGISFAGVQADRASSVVYVVDTSGAMASSFTLIVDELERSLSQLDPTQLFQVVSFRDRTIIDPADTEKATLMGAGPDLIEASPANRTRVIRRLRESVLPTGRSDPAPALELALSLDPDAVFLLTRSIRRTGPGQDADTPVPGGAFPPWSESWRDELLAHLETLNPIGPRGRPTLIKAIQFLDHDPTGTLQTIGTRHGGDAGYVVRSPADLKQLVEAPPPDRNRQRERVERAGALLNDIAARNLDWQVLFGYPTDAERQLVIQNAQRAISEIGSAQGTHDASALLHLARSGVLLAAAGKGSVRTDAIATARQALDELAEAVDERARWHREHLRLLLASVDGGRMSTDLVRPEAPAWGEKDLQIESMLAQLRVGEPEAFPAFCSLMAEALREPPFARMDGDGRVREDPALVVLTIDAMAQRAMQIARQTEPADQAWARLAIAQILQLRRRNWIERDQREALILDRVGRLLDKDIILRLVQPEATLARARALLVGEDPRSAEPLLRDLLVRPDADHLAPRALLALSDLLATESRMVRRAQAPMMLLTLTEGWPESPEAQGAVQRALFLSRSILDTASPSDRVIALNSYHQLLSDAKVLSELEDRDYWLAQHDAVLLELAKHHDSNYSLHLLEQIRPGSPEAPVCVPMYRRLVRVSIKQMHDRHLELRDVPGREVDAQVALEGAARHARNALALYKAHGVGEDTAVERESLARTYQLMGLPQRQLAALEKLLPYADELEGGAFAIQIRIAKLERTLEDVEKAFARLRAVTQETQPTDEAFWHAWTLVLEILRDQNTQGDRTGTIRAHIAMLSTLDEQLGGDPWHTRIRAIADQPTP